MKFFEIFRKIKTALFTRRWHVEVNGQKHTILMTNEFMGRNFKLSYDDKIILRLKNDKELRDGKNVVIDQSNKLFLQLDIKGLKIFMNGKIIPGSAGSIEADYEFAALAMYIYGAIFLFISLFKALSFVNEFDDMVLYLCGIGLALLFIVCGYFIQKISLMALSGALLLASMDVIYMMKYYDTVSIHETVKVIVALKMIFILPVIKVFFRTFKIMILGEK